MRTIEQTSLLPADTARPAAEQADAVRFTAAAVARVQELLAHGHNPDLKLRVRVQGRGGCTGFQYGFSFEEDAATDDTTLERSGVKLLVDPDSFHHLLGAQIDYCDDAGQAQFVVRNPNAPVGCDCGTALPG